MTSINAQNVKQPFKLIEIPLNKFSDEAIPYHKQLLQQNKNVIQKLTAVNNVDQLSREIKDKKRTVQQLKDLMYELDTLRAQVENSDLDKFDTKTLSLRKTILNLLSEYSALEKSAQQIINEHIQDSEVTKSPLDGATQIQIQEKLMDLKLKEHENRLQCAENLNSEIQDLHGMYVQIGQMVHTQKDDVNVIEANVEIADSSIKEGLSHLNKAARLKATVYPISGALLGGIIGGPVGLFAGMKAGSLAALGCCLAGYTGGKIINKMNEDDSSPVESDNSMKKSAGGDDPSAGSPDKKDI